MRWLLIIFSLCLQFAKADILSEIKSRGFLNCGVTTGLPGFSTMSEDGQWTGFEVDYCRGIAAAIFRQPASHPNPTNRRSLHRWNRDYPKRYL